MKIRLLTPTEIVFEGEVEQIHARGHEGAFTLLPAHQDYVAALSPGVLTCRDGGDHYRLAAVDQGVLVKCGPAVTVCTRHAVLGDDWDELSRRVQVSFIQQSKREKRAAAALAKLETGMMQQLVHWSRYEKP